MINEEVCCPRDVELYRNQKPLLKYLAGFSVKTLLELKEKSSALGAPLKNPGEPPNEIVLTKCSGNPCVLAFLSGQKALTVTGDIANVKLRP